MVLSDKMKSQGDWLFRFRSSLPLYILPIVIYLYVFSGSELLLNEELKPIVEYVCLGVSLLGLLIRVYTVGYTPRNTSGRNTTEGQIADVLNQTGIYSIMRNPLYVGNFLMWFGIVLLTCNVWFIVSFILFYLLYYERIVYAEEDFLKQKFGETYKAWAVNTPVALPKLNGFVPPNASFNWRKVFRQEKNGLAATFVIFLMLDVSRSWYFASSDYNSVYLYGSLVSCVLYLILKTLKYNTKVLAD
jgi:protein-S-isoprenylcysteine O-methyltransferase Ste14